MAKTVKRKAVSGRATPKGGAKPGRTTPNATARYTPPIPRDVKVSPRWVPVVMFILLGVGVLTILLNYIGYVPGGTSNWYLLGGLALILGGIIAATQYH